MFDKKVLNIYVVIIGVFFLISGIGKVINTTGFSYLINQYGLGYLMLLAPIIVLAEIGLGISLLLLLNPKRDSLIAFIFLAAFTIAFGFAHFMHGVNDCGCFGTLQPSNLPPAFTFLRNFILLAIALIVWLKYPKEETGNINGWKKRLVLGVMGVSIFVSGFTFRMPDMFHADIKKNKFQDQNVKATELAKYITTSMDKRYLVFCFSYTCPHCWNSIENLRGFKKSGTVDSIVVLAVGDSAGKAFFNHSFSPDFIIRDLSTETMMALTNLYPTAFYVKNDTVKVIIEGEVPSPVTFKKQYALSNN